jgi:hypothetical protein
VSDISPEHPHVINNSGQYNEITKCIRFDSIHIPIVITGVMSRWEEIVRDGLMITEQNDNSVMYVFKGNGVRLFEAFRTKPELPDDTSFYILCHNNEKWQELCFSMDIEQILAMYLFPCGDLYMYIKLRNGEHMMCFSKFHSGCCTTMPIELGYTKQFMGFTEDGNIYLWCFDSEGSCEIGIFDKENLDIIKIIRPPSIDWTVRVLGSEVLVENNHLVVKSSSGNHRYFQFIETGVQPGLFRKMCFSDVEFLFD